MDIEKLRFYLKDEYYYQDTTKDIFLEEIEEIFICFKEEDSHLLAYKGNCVGLDCENCGTTGYRFVGNNSKSYITLLFIEQEDDIKDIFTCSKFKTDEDIEDLAGEANVFIHYDENINFEATPEYWSKVNAALEAYNEIVSTPPYSITLEDIEYWLTKHTFTSERIGSEDAFSTQMRWTPFTRLYAGFMEIKEFASSYQEELTAAVASLKTLKEEQQIVDWIIKHELLFKKVPSDLIFCIPRKNNEYLTNTTSPILFSGSSLKLIFEFIKQYKHHHDEMLHKYSIFSDEDISAIFSDHQYHKDTDNVYILSFHMDKRKEAAELGIEKPFFIARRQSDNC